MLRYNAIVVSRGLLHAWILPRNREISAAATEISVIAKMDRGVSVSLNTMNPATAADIGSRLLNTPKMLMGIDLKAISSNE